MTTESVGKTGRVEVPASAQSESTPLISRKLLLFMVAMVLANIGGNMYGPLLPLYLKSLNASVV